MRPFKAFRINLDDRGFRRNIAISAIFLTALIVLGLTVTVDGRHREQPEVVRIPFSASEIRIEVNSTDGDAGLQIFLDGEPWKRARVEGPDNKTIFSVTNIGKLKKLGSTELFMESNEPNFEEELSLPEILEFLPVGEYEFEGKAIEGEVLEGMATLTHDLPCGPVIISPEEDAELDAGDPLVIMWEEVTNKLDTDSDIGECDTESEITIIGYEVIVDNESLDPLERFSIRLPADVTAVTVPPEFNVPGSEYKFEILAIEESGNQTISESSFTTSEIL